MPTAGDAELQEATQTFKDYMAVVLRMYERIKQEEARDSPKIESQDRVRNDLHL
jgi:hypothetical protein